MPKVKESLREIGESGSSSVAANALISIGNFSEGIIAF